MKAKIALVLLGIATMLASCSKFIDLTSPDLLPPDKFYKTEGDIKAAVTGAYALLRTNYSNYYQLNEMPSDNAESRSNSEVAIGGFDKLSWTAYTTNFEGFWINYYHTIAQCNLVLSKMEGVPFVAAATKAGYSAEIKFIRALMYFELVRTFGDVPLILKLIDSSQEASSYLRTPAADIYTQIEKDLLEAEGGLPEVYATADNGRVTKIAVKALLGKVYLYQKKYREAEARLAEVVSNKNYDLLPSLTDIFSTANEFNKEIIFTIQYSRVLAGVSEGSSFAAQFFPQNSGLTTAANSGYNLGTLDLYRAFKKGDKRKDLMGTFINGKIKDSAHVQFYYYTRKFTDNPPTVSDGENNWIVIRFADVVLLYAEALNEQGKTDGAINQLNRIRVRAGLTGVAATLTRDQTRAAIKNERRLELCFEGHRWPDLVRWNDYLSVMTAFKNKYKVSTMSPNDYVKLFPIPNRERVINPELTQNPGY